MEQWKEYKLGDVLCIKYGKDHKLLASGSIPIYGSGGIMRYADRSIYEGPSILIPRKGSLNNIMYSDKPFWTVDTMFWTTINEKIANPKYLYYLLSKKDFASLNVGSAVPSLTVPVIENIHITLPTKSVQDKVVSLLSSLDDKIELNRRINDNLEQQATALFDKMFPSITNGNCKIGDWLRPKRGIGLLTKDTILGDVPVVAGGLRPAAYHNKANTLSPVVTISASGANAGYVALWNKPVWSSDSSYIDSSLTSDVYFWYVMLKKRQKEIFDAQTGSAQPHIYPQHIAELPIKQLEKEQIIKYTEQATPLFKMVGNLTEENIKLAQLRDTLLPRLMSGELKIS